MHTMKLPIEPQPVPLREDSGGVLRIGKTRVTLETVVALFRNGASAEEIAADFPLALDDVYTVIAYYLRHRNEVDAYVRGVEADAEQIKAEMEARPEYAAFRERLMERARTMGLR